jgi:mannosyl-3-phosphoglycerate phosphatase family protein
MSTPGNANQPSAMVIVTDLDGTLLDRDSYDFAPALPALDLIRTRGIPLVLCSSKTRAEQMALRERLCIDDPFIVEDGSAICTPEDYFSSAYASEPVGDGLTALRLGPGYHTVRRAIREVVEETGVSLTGYGDMTDAEVAALTGLDMDAAARARAREYQETIVTPLDDGSRETVRHALAARGMRLTRGGRFHGVTGASDKGTAVSILAELFREKLGPIQMVGLGDSYNDVSMLRAVDVPALVQKKGETWEPLNLDHVERVAGVGPSGWNQFVTRHLTGGVTPPPA